MVLRGIGGLAIAVGLVGNVVVAAESFTYAELVGQLVDLGRLAVLPAPGETCAQWSSYDRASRYDEATGKYVNWGANNDGPQFIRREGTRQVMAEMEGPGCIWRIWSAMAEKGHVAIYLDGSDRPALDMPFADYFDGKHAPFGYAQLSYDLKDQGSRGQNLYLPIPYQKSCKIVADEGWGRYFQFTYRTYPKGTQLPTFSVKLAADNAAAIARVNDFLADRVGADPAGARPGQETVARDVELAGGQSARVAELAGPRAITAVHAKVAIEDREAQMAALRELVLKISWDAQAKPAVWCPLGDFFGTAPGINVYKSLVTGMTPEGFYAYWYMPFGEKAVVELANEGAASRRVGLEIVHAPLGRAWEGLGHFHARWHRDTETVSDDRFPDWLMLRTEGRGRFCGVMLHVWNPRGGWWGEGDEKFFVDGEKFPSTIGTGSEDYFGYAWCCPNLFQRAYHAQTMTQNNRGHQSVLRWHVVDNVPFQKSFEACIEKYFTNAARGTLYACLPCWYLAPGGTNSYEPVPVGQRDGYYAVPDLLAGGFKVLNFPRGNVTTQELARYGKGRWTNDDHLWWTGARPGAKLELAVPVAKAGKYAVSVVLTKARDYGIVQLSLDGAKVGPRIDLYSPRVTRSEPIALGAHELSAGEHKLEVEIVGANENAVPSFMFGVDEIRVEPVQ